MKLLLIATFFLTSTIFQFSFADEQSVENDMLNGLEGLNTLLKQGKIRLATPDDIDAWVKAAREKDKTDEVNAKRNMRLGATYVVLEEIYLPDELYGAHSVSFIIPNEVPIPNGPPGHNQFYFMKGGFCTLAFITECPEG